MGSWNYCTDLEAVVLVLHAEKFENGTRVLFVCQEDVEKIDSCRCLWGTKFQFDLNKIKYMHARHTSHVWLSTIMILVVSKFDLLTAGMATQHQPSHHTFTLGRCKVIR
jgi:hypothetical protein